MEKDAEQQLRHAGERLALTRKHQREAMADLLSLVRAFVPEEVSEKRAAELAGVDRMTVRKALGKR